MKRATIFASGVFVAAAASATLAAAAPERGSTPQAAPKKQKVLTAFYRDRTVRYFDYGRIRLRRGNKLAPIWVFTNGASGQRSIVDSVPGQRRYSALRTVNTVTWAAGATPRVLRSASAVRAALSSRELTTRGRAASSTRLYSASARHAIQASRGAGRSTTTSLEPSRWRRETRCFRSGRSRTACAGSATSPTSFPERPRTRRSGG
jgi:hypothetical protein